MQEVLDRLRAIKDEIQQTAIKDSGELEQYRVRFLGSKNVLKDIFSEMKNIPPADRKSFGEQVNEVKQLAESVYDQKKQELSGGSKSIVNKPDLTLPGDKIIPGSLHPVTIVRNQIVDLFARIGFTVATGPDIEDEWHNFTALNTPPDHPARDMTDTFYISVNPDVVLRSQTSTVQVRTMEQQKPPIRIVAPGRVYRNETISYKHHVYFHQLEGLYIDRRVSFADLKQTLYFFIKEFFGEDFNIRFRPSYFPFTEPSGELDIAHKSSTKWMEILGCGMVHPNVLNNCGIDSREYTGFAFGLGIERLAMLKYGITDIRTLYDNDIRVLKQFTHA
jgi:phenylalanyl-tRNA synthetase alpha chain